MLVIGYIEGTAVSDKIILAGGVGYLVLTTRPFEAGSQYSLWVAAVYRQESAALYGFQEQLEHDCFLALCKVPGVGPGMALNVLRDVGVSGLATLDPAVIKKASGVGLKKAQAIATSVVLPAGAIADAPDSSSAVVLVLEGLGFGGDESRAAVRSALAQDPQGDDEDILSLSLAALRK